MHQIFYIDIDEEITSIVDRLKKSKTTENFFVVSPRSLLLQSVVSLKLLKREAAKEKKQIAIVVNEKEASLKVEKAGILVLSSLKGLEGGEEIKESFSSKMEIKDNNKNKYKNTMETEKTVKKSRLQKIGTDDFFNENPKKDEPAFPVGNRVEDAKPSAPFYPSSPEKTLAPALNQEPRNTSDVRKESTNFSYIPEKNFEEARPSMGNQNPYGKGRISDMKEMDPYKEKLVEGFFRPKPKMNSIDSMNRINEPAKEKFEEKAPPVSGGMKKIIFGFVFISLAAAFLIAAYLFVPKATVAVSIKNEIKKFDLELKGNTNESQVNANDLVVPAKVIEKEDSLTSSFKSSGKKSSSSDVSQKAKGKITIYNSFGKESQQLVATTRFLSTDGKLFRLVKGVTVPGMTDSGTTGSIEADVIADQPGEEYNIDPADFKIPGFEGSPKYDKFYAKSTSAMSGGGAGSSGGVAVISQNDLDNAKKDSENQIKTKLEDEVKGEIGAGYVLLTDAEDLAISQSASLSRLNEATSSFDYKVSGKIKAMVFSESDLKKLAGNIYNEANKEKTISDYSLIKINYGVSSADFNAGTMNLKINAEVPVAANTDWNDFKNKILGKNDEQIKEIIKGYPQIDRVDIDFWPNFMSQKIPQYEKRVEIQVKTALD